MKRRKFIKKSLFAGLGIAATTSLYAWRIEPFLPEFTHVKMPVQNLPNHLNGKTLMQISDMHIGNRFNYNYIIKTFEEAQERNPDFVVYTGDYVSYENENQIKQLNQVMKHAVRGSLGTIGILGNHDYGKNWSEESVAKEICKTLQNNGVEVLRNEQKDFSGLNFIGIDDYWSVNFFPEIAMRNYNSALANVVLCHNPDVCDLDVWNSYEGWILSGHTHGGQVKAPFLPPPVLPVKNKNFSAGKIELSHNRKLYINRAIGHLWQVRFMVRPEITVFELVEES